MTLTNKTCKERSFERGWRSVAWIDVCTYTSKGFHSWTSVEVAYELMNAIAIAMNTLACNENDL